MRPEQRSRRDIDIPILHGLRDFVDPDPARGQLVGIYLHVNGVFLRPGHQHLRHAANGGDTLRHQGLGIVIDHPHRKSGRGQSHEQQRHIGRIALAE